MKKKPIKKKKRPSRSEIFMVRWESKWNKQGRWRDFLIRKDGQVLAEMEQIPARFNGADLSWADDREVVFVKDSLGAEHDAAPWFVLEILSPEFKGRLLVFRVSVPGREKRVAECLAGGADGRANRN